jgi:hypothetical protein
MHVQATLQHLIPAPSIQQHQQQQQPQTMEEQFPQQQQQQPPQQQRRPPMRRDVCLLLHALATLRFVPAAPHSNGQHRAQLLSWTPAVLSALEGQLQAATPRQLAVSARALCLLQVRIRVCQGLMLYH